MRNLLLCSFVLFVLNLCGCKQKPIDQPYIPSPNSVAFDMTRSGSGDGIVGEWIATYSAGSKTARFKIVIDPSQGGSDGIAFGKGRFVSMPGSDSATLLSALKTALQAKTLPNSPKRVSDVPFTLANLGDHLSRDPDGSFNSKPSGGWTAAKIFMEDGNDDDIEVFMNLNPSMKKGEFSIKDPDYGDAAVAKLATVL